MSETPHEEPEQRGAWRLRLAALVRRFPYLLSAEHRERLDRELERRAKAARHRGTARRRDEPRDGGNAPGA